MSVGVCASVHVCVCERERDFPLNKLLVSRLPSIPWLNGWILLMDG